MSFKVACEIADWGENSLVLLKITDIQSTSHLLLGALVRLFYRQQV